MLKDSFGRVHDYLRISLTDVCNFRCTYCMPENMTFAPKKENLETDELILICQAFVELGIKKIRLTGGEPLLRRNLERLIAELAKLPVELTLTTNGSLLASKAQALKDAGLHRVTVSLDGLDDEIFRRMNDVDFPVADVLRGIEAAQVA